MIDVAIREIADGDNSAVIALWTASGLVRPWNDPALDLAFARRQDNASVLVAHKQSDSDAIVATVMVGHDGHRGTVYYLAVRPDARRCGVGRTMMDAAENWLQERGIWKINVMIRADNAKVLGFYDAIGYSDSRVVVREKWLDESKRFAAKP